MTDAILPDQELAGGHYPVTTQRSLSAIDLHIGDCRTVLRSLPAESVHTVVTSPPYWSLRDYGVNGQYGLETTPLRYLARMRSVFREIRRVMRPDATLWLNMGDSHYTPRVPTGIGHNSTINGKGSQQAAQDARRTMRSGMQWSNRGSLTGGLPSRRRAAGAAGMMGLKPKDMVGMPWLLALTLRADGWYLRSDIIWAKPSPMPESVRDRPTKAHEYLFLLSKSERYHFDLEAFKEPTSGNAHPRGQGVNPKARRPKVAGWADGAGKHEAVHHARAGHASPTKFARARQNESYSAAVTETVTRRNRRTVWTIPPEPLKEEHYAAYPTALVEPCILAGCPVGGVVLDPFGGSGTTAIVAARHHRNAVLIELSHTYAKMAAERMRRELGLLHTLTVHP